jgi:hypothetical protein
MKIEKLKGRNYYKITYDPYVVGDLNSAIYVASFILDISALTYSDKGVICSMDMLMRLFHIKRDLRK